MQADLPTRVPAVVDALVTRARTLYGDTAMVLDGPRTAEDLPEDVVVIGQPNTGGESVTNDVERAEGLGHRYVETFEVYCVASSVGGDTDMKARRDRCLELVQLLEQGLKQDRGLGGVCDLVGLGPSMNWAQAQTPDGSVCEVAFSVVGQAAL